MPASYELHLFRPKAGATTGGGDVRPAGADFATEPFDHKTIGSFLLSLGPQIRFGVETELGEQYVYEDEQGCMLEIVISQEQAVLGFPDWHQDPQAERCRWVANALALALVARFGLTLYDPQTGRSVQARRR